MKNTQTLNLDLFRFEIGTHKENNVIWIHFPKNFENSNIFRFSITLALLYLIFHSTTTTNDANDDEILED